MTHLGKLAAHRDANCACCRTDVTRPARAKAHRAQRRRERQEVRRASRAGLTGTPS